MRLRWSTAVGAESVVPQPSRDRLPGVNDLEALIDRFSTDMNLEVGKSRALPADAGLALYRGAQEALTNVARYYPAPAPWSCCATGPIAPR
jgi:signal transduction histidine kinase